MEHTWHADDPDRLVRRGHPIGDFLEAYEWRVLERRDGFLRVQAHLPDHVHNHRGHMFGGFAAAYVDFVCVATLLHTTSDVNVRGGMITANVHIDYFAPVATSPFVLECEIVHRRGRTFHMQARFCDPDGTLLSLATATLLAPQD